MLKLSTPAAILLGAGIIGVLAAAFPRLTISPTAYGYVERDRWTGQTLACSVEHPWNYIRSATIDKGDPPLVCVDLKAPAQH